MFQTKVVDESNKRFEFSNSPPENRAVYEIM